MTIPIHCPKCGGFKPAPDQWAGKLVECDDCGARFKVPAKGAKRRKEREDKPAGGSSPAQATPAPKESRRSSGATVPAQCDACGREYQVPSELAGRHCRCLDCGAVVEVPFPLTDADVKPATGPRTGTPKPAPARRSQPQPVPAPQGPLDGLLDEELAAGPAVSRPTAGPVPVDNSFAPPWVTSSGITLPRKKQKKRSRLSGVASLGRNPIVALVLGNKLLTAVLVVYLFQVLGCLRVLAVTRSPLVIVSLIPGLVVVAVGFAARTREGDTAAAGAVCGLWFLAVAGIWLTGFPRFREGMGPGFPLPAVLLGFGVASMVVLLIAGAVIGLFYLLFRLLGTFRVLGTLHLAAFFAGLVIAMQLGGEGRDQSTSTTYGDAASSGSLRGASLRGDSARADGQTGLFAIPDLPLPDFPGRPRPRRLTEGVEMSEVHLGVPTGQPGHADVVWVYTPPGTHAPRSLPCVLIAPAGSNLISGMRLGSGDRPEHLPYVKAGFAVVAFELDGPLDNRHNASDLDVRRAYLKFSAAKAGLVNARNAIEFVLQRVPEVDPDRICAAGHSSAATFALLLAEHEPRISACVAYAPAVDALGRWGDAADDLADVLPGSIEFLKRSSPITHAEHLDCPVFLFHARDDSNTRVEESIRLADKLRRLGKDVTLVTVPTGGHYDSMIDEGIPRGIQWLSSQARVGPSPDLSTR